MKSFIEAFPNATFWYVKKHGLFVAKLDSPAIDYRLLKERFRNPAVRDDLASVDIDSPEEFLTHLLMGPEEIQAFVNADGSAPLNTDDYPYLEFVAFRRMIMPGLARPDDMFDNFFGDVEWMVREVTGGVLTVTGEDGQVVEAPLAIGESYTRSAGVRHDVANFSSTPVAFVEVELLDHGLAG